MKKCVLIVLMLSTLACSGSSSDSAKQTAAVLTQANEFVTAMAATFAVETSLASEAQATTTPDQNVSVTATLPATDEPASSMKVDYEVVYLLPNHRYDGGASLYVLIDPVDLTSEAFKDDVKAIIREIVLQKGNKISIEIYDNRDVLNLSYKQYGDLSLGRPFTDEEFDSQAVHLIGTYDGDLETNIYLNTLMFFPGAFTSTPDVGKYVDFVEFDASAQ